MLELARGFTASGQPVFPLRPLSKIPFAGTSGLKDATTNLAQVEAWWTESPESNIGLPTGIVFDAIDVDGIEGANALEEWAETHGGARTIPDPTVLTPSGGYHIYVTPTGVGNRAGMLPHVDYRGRGGYVLAPGSKLPHGEYRWL